MFVLVGCQSFNCKPRNTSIDILTASYFHKIINNLCVNEFNFLLAINQGEVSEYFNNEAYAGHDVFLWNIHTTPDNANIGELLFTIRLSRYEGDGLVCTINGEKLFMYMEFINEEDAISHFEFLSESYGEEKSMSIFLQALYESCKNTRYTHDISKSKLVDIRTIELFHKKLNAILTDKIEIKGKSYAGMYAGILPHYGRALYFVSFDEAIEECMTWYICEKLFFEEGKQGLLQEVCGITISPFKGDGDYIDVGDEKIIVDFKFNSTDSEQNSIINILLEKLKTN